MYSESKHQSGAYINIKINSIKIAEQEYFVNFTTVVKNLPRREDPNALVPVLENFMDEYTDETFKQGKMTPDHNAEGEEKVSFWQKLNLFKS